MAENVFKRIGEKFLLNAVKDIPDMRDRYYEPSLIPVKPEIDVPNGLVILNQGQEGACTGFGLAAVINLLTQAPSARQGVSPRMLYEMARRFDEWMGEDYSGSSCRGAIRGWYHNGVCLEAEWPYSSGSAGHLNPTRAKSARCRTIGAYYRLRPHVADYHCALNETGVLYLSAQVHEGWQSPKDGRIEMRSEIIGGHAFALVGYNAEGFWVQNSWGEGWGQNGVALWSYEDWQQNVQDAWVVALAYPTPAIFPGVARIGLEAKREQYSVGDPTRSQIAGHFVHLDDGKFHPYGKYSSTLEDTRETVRLLSKSDKYEHILLYAHGGLNSIGAAARRIAATTRTFKENGIYPYHFMYDTGLLEELKDVVFRKKEETVGRSEGITDASDRLIEMITRTPGRALWREMKSGARSPFESGGDGRKVIKAFADLLQAGKKTRRLHLVGHSTGGILLAYLLAELKRLKVEFRVASCSLLAPAATLDLFRSNYLPLLGSTDFGIDDFAVYNLNAQLEAQDTVGGVYRKSLLYLVSRAFEENCPAPLMGMMVHAAAESQLSQQAVYISQGAPSAGKVVPTASTSHGGFDNDPFTMNHLLKRILQREPKSRFNAAILNY
jgi:hypothetical protein